MRDKGEAISASQCRSLMGTDRAKRLFKIAQDEGLIEQSGTTKKGGHDVELYRHVEEVTGD